MKAIHWRAQRRTAWWQFWMIIGVLTLVASSEPLAAGNLPPLPEGLMAPEQPTQMPDFQLPQVNGTTFNSADVSGKVLLIRFWSTW